MQVFGITFLDRGVKLNGQNIAVCHKSVKFSGLIYRMSLLYARKCLIMFYNSFAISIVTYALPFYGSTAKPNLKS